MRRCIGTTAVVAMLLPAALPIQLPAATPVERYELPASGGIPVEGHGYGNGIGMSQWGAYGAAKVDGLSTQAILSFYYPTTTIVKASTTRVIRVELDTMDAPAAWAEVEPAKGLAVQVDGTSVALPTATTATKSKPSVAITGWRLERSDSKVVLQDQAAGDWHTYATTPAITTSAAFTDTANVLAVSSSEGGGSTSYRGSLVVTLASGDLYAVDAVNIESYLDSVVPSEMPSSWSPAALRVQAVASRTYATYDMNHPRSSLFDIYSDTRDQAYSGITREAASTDAAVLATAGQVLRDSSGHVVFAAYGSADGGYTVASQVGGQDDTYLTAHADPYDGLVANDDDSWTGEIETSTVAADFPSIGTPQSITIDSRDGNGEWGGRITEVTVTGSSGSEQVAGSTFSQDVGLKGPWWLPQLPPGPVRYALTTATTAAGTGKSPRTVSLQWSAPASGPGYATPTGYVVTASPGGRSVRVSKTHATLKDLPAATSYQLTIRPTSASGMGTPVLISTAVTRVADSAALSQQEFSAGGARAAVVIDPSDLADAAGAGVLAAAADGPVLVADSSSSLGASATGELKRVVASHGDVYLVGDFTEAVAKIVAKQGLSAVPVTGATPQQVAFELARDTAKLRAEAKHPVNSVIEIDGAALGSLTTAAAAAAAATEVNAVVLLTDGSMSSPQLDRWLAKHPTARRWAIGKRAAEADPGAEAIEAPGAAPGLTAAIARRFFKDPTQVSVVSSTDSTSALAASATDGPVLAVERSLPTAAITALAKWRSRIGAARVIGTAGAPAYSILAALDAALL